MLTVSPPDVCPGMKEDEVGMAFLVVDDMCFFLQRLDYSCVGEGGVGTEDEWEAAGAGGGTDGDGKGDKDGGGFCIFCSIANNCALMTSSSGFNASRCSKVAIFRCASTSREMM